MTIISNPNSNEKTSQAISSLDPENRVSASHSVDLRPSTPRNARLARSYDAFENTAAVTLTITVDGQTSSNASFAAALCNQLNSTVTQLSIVPLSNTVYALFEVSSCLGTLGTGLTQLAINGPSFVLTNFSYIPSNVLSLSLNGILCRPLAASATLDGFDTAGNLDWNEIFQILPTVPNFNFGSLVARGSVPTWLPPAVIYISLSNARLSGTISSTLLSNTSLSTAITIDFSNNSLSGGIPVGLLSPFAGGASKSSLTLYLQDSGLDGTIPKALFTPLNDMILSYFYANFNGNSLTGSLPTFPPAMTPATALGADFTLLIANNKLTGSISESTLNLTLVDSIAFDASNNSLSGSLPSRLFSSNTWTKKSGTSVSITLSNNMLSGEIPATFLTGGLSATANATASSFSLYLDNNQLSGSIPNRLFYQVPTSKRSDDMEEIEEYSAAASLTSRSALATTITSWKATTLLYMNVAGNRLSGSLPGDIFNYSFSGNGPSITLILDNNSNITDVIPDTLFTSIADTSTTRLHTLSATNTSLSGSPPGSGFCRQRGRVSLALDKTMLNGTIPTAWTNGCRFLKLSFQNCPSFASTIPSGLFTSSSVTTFSALNTPLIGAMPDVSSNLTTLELGYTNVDFCTSVPSSLGTAWAGNLQRCSLANTSACECSQSYNSWCTVACSDWHFAPVTPVTPPLSPPTTPISPPTGCNSNSKPGPEFTCVAGVWTAPTTNATTLVIPSGAGAVVITGDLPSESIVLQGLGTSIEVAGCADNLTTITVELDPSQLGSLSTSSKALQTLLTTGNASCSTELSSVGVAVKVKSGCKKVKSSSVVLDEGTTLGAYFTLDKSGCNSWWIILVSVICGVILVVVVGLVLLAVFYAPFREKIRPFSKKRKPAADLS